MSSSRSPGKPRRTSRPAFRTDRSAWRGRRRSSSTTRWRTVFRGPRVRGPPWGRRSPRRRRAAGFPDVLLPRRGAFRRRLRQRRVGGHPPRGLPEGRLGGAQPGASPVPDHDRQHGLPSAIPPGRQRGDPSHAKRRERVPPDRPARDPLPPADGGHRRAAGLRDSFHKYGSGTPAWAASPRRAGLRSWLAVR